MLLKGVNKRVIVIKNPESEIFEKAYFIVKNKSIFNKAKENEMVLEANRIIADYSRQQKQKISAADIKNKSGGKNSKTNKSEKSEKKAADNVPHFITEPDFDDADGINDINDIDDIDEDFDGDFFSGEKFFAGNSSAGLSESDRLNLKPYSPLLGSGNSGFKFISAKKICGKRGARGFKFFRLPRPKAPPKSFFVGVGVMSALIIAVRIFAFILSR